MKKKLEAEVIFKTLREARRRIEIHSMPQHSPSMRPGAEAALMIITAMFMKALGISVDSPDNHKQIVNIWKKPPRFEKQVNQEALDYLEGLTRDAARACTCDGGGAICRACVAEREIDRLKANGTFIAKTKTNYRLALGKKVTHAKPLRKSR